MTLVHVLLALVMFSMDIIQQCNFGALDVVLGGLVSHDEGNAKIARAGALHRCVSASAEPRELKFDDHIDEYSFSPPGVPPSGGSGWGVRAMPCSPAGSSQPVPGIVANADTATKTTYADMTRT